MCCIENFIDSKSSYIYLFCFLSDNKLQEELLRTTQLVYSYKDGKGMVSKSNTNAFYIRSNLSAIKHNQTSTILYACIKGEIGEEIIIGKF